MSYCMSIKKSFCWFENCYQTQCRFYYYFSYGNPKTNVISCAIPHSCTKSSGWFVNLIHDSLWICYSFVFSLGLYLSLQGCRRCLHGVESRGVWDAEVQFWFWGGHDVTKLHFICLQWLSTSIWRQVLFVVLYNACRAKVHRYTSSELQSEFEVILNQVDPKLSNFPNAVLTGLVISRFCSTTLAVLN